MPRFTPRAAAAILAASALAAACGKGPRQPEALRVNARSGATVDLSRTTWETCLDGRPAAGQSERSRIVHGDKGVVTYTFETFDAPGCTGTAGPLRSLAGVGFVEGQRAVAWSGTPAAGLPASPIATKVLYEAGNLVVGSDCLWLDDTVTPRVLYAGAPGSPSAVDGIYPDLLLAGGWAAAP